MSSLGPYLRDLRERRGVSLEEMARTTRVGRPYLEALESDDFSSLPAPVFTRGFILAYCEALDAPSDEAIARYTGRAAVREPASAPASAARDDSRTPKRGPVLVSFTLLIVLGFSLFAVSQVLQSGRRGTVAPHAMSPSEAPPPAMGGDAVRRPGTPETVPAARENESPGNPPRSPAPGAPVAATVKPGPVSNAPPSTPSAVPTVSQDEVSAALASATAPYRLIARTTASTWLRVRMADGRQVDETIPAGQAREWVSNRPFTLTIGNAGGVKLELNGRALPTLGAPGAVITRLVVPAETP